MLARETFNVKRNFDLPQDESAPGLKNSPGTKLHTRSFLVGISEREATTTRTPREAYGSRFARMPTSQNRDMGHPILWLNLDVGHPPIARGQPPRRSVTPLDKCSAPLKHGRHLDFENASPRRTLEVDA